MVEIIAFRLKREGRGRWVALGLALALGGCSFPIPGFIDDSATGAIKTKSYPFAAEDWVAAEPAMRAAIGAYTGAEAATWSNAASGRSGSVAAVGARFSRDGAQCRTFVARIDAGENRRAFQGSACERGRALTVSDVGPLSGA